METREAGEWLDTNPNSVKKLSLFEYISDSSGFVPELPVNLRRGKYPTVTSTTNWLCRLGESSGVSKMLSFQQLARDSPGLAIASVCCFLLPGREIAYLTSWARNSPSHSWARNSPSHLWASNSLEITE